ncbi:MAG: type IV secretory system conjugative DNA transfer family protein [Rickettsiaceae bacterium]|nr:type IV secretory system conjugative DNA transfer family protein [Rickettsiaceae bacterium]
MQEYQRLISQAIIHITAIFSTFWIAGALIACLTDERGALGPDLSGILIFYKWHLWIYTTYQTIDFFTYIKGYGYLKLEILGISLSSFVGYGTLMYYYWDRISEVNFFTPGEKLHGDAHWATEYDVRRSGLRSKSGVLLGVDKRGYYVNEGFQHILLFAPTGAGKGVGFVIPNLLFWEHSIVVHDIKLENYDLTSGWRASQGQEVFVWEPANPDGISHCYNPLDWVSNKPGQMVDDVQKIANLILPKQDFWENEARSLFLGLILYLIADPNKTTSFGEAVRTMRNDDYVYNFAVVMDTMGKDMHPVGYMNLSAFLQKPDKERGSVASTLNSAVELWANPLIDATTARSDFNILDFKKKKTTVYVGLTPDNIQRLQKLMQIFYQQATEFLCRKMPDLKNEPYGVMFLMDEFPTLGKMDQFKAGIAYFRGYRVRLFLIVQDTQQLKGTYEDAGMNSFLSNSTFRITYAANNYETAQLISQLCGNKTVEQSSVSKKMLDMPTEQSVSLSSASRALLLPQEVMLLPRDEQIVLIESFPPIKSKKIFYYKDKFFTARLIKPVFVPTQAPYDPRVVKDELPDDAEAEASVNEELEAQTA